jgi:CheY-like chemotaxis protein
MIRGAEVWPAFCDGAQLESAVLNLAVNARDAMPEGGKLTIAVGNSQFDAAYAAVHPGVTPGDYVMIAVTDTGVGMSRDVIEHAFEPFFTTKSEGCGTGLGLSQVFGFVTQSRGHVRIESIVGEGTTVRLYLPTATEAAAPPLAADDGEAPHGAGETILIVEDDGDVRAAVVAMVSDLGYAVIEADGPEQALRILAERPVMLVFSDVVMPGPITSRQLAERARALQPGAKMLFTSGYTQNRIDHDGRLDEGIELIVKPYRRDELARRLRNVLGAGRPPR